MALPRWAHAAGLAWLVIAILGGVLAVGAALLVVTLPIAIVLAIGAFLIPFLFVGGIWFARSAVVALAACIYPLALITLAVANGARLSPALVLLLGLSVISGKAALELNGTDQAA